jgi:hypothetical protein
MEADSPLFALSWDSPIAWASCGKCPTDVDGHVLIQEQHGCGIYSTRKFEILKGYLLGAYHVAILIEALGTYWFHDNGITSAGALVLGVVDTSFHWAGVNLAQRALAYHYGVPILGFEEAGDIIKWSWDKYYPEAERSFEW